MIGYFAQMSSGTRVPIKVTSECISEIQKLIVELFSVMMMSYEEHYRLIG